METKYASVSVAASVANGDAGLVVETLTPQHRGTRLDRLGQTCGDQGMRNIVAALCVVAAAACGSKEAPFAGRKEQRDGKMLACIWAGNKAGMCDNPSGCLNLATLMSGPGKQWACRQQLVVYCVEKPSINDTTSTTCFGNLAACRNDIHGPCTEVTLSGEER